jgi:pimeloyl-ACP methyl ester carboxylesterase
MQDLASRVASLYKKDQNGNYTPIRVVKIGDNEYLVMLAGTVGGPKSNNWFSAIMSGAGLPSDYQAQIKSILLALPAGAMVHIAGHSQGGIMGNNLAADREIQKHVQVKSVTTFGSPVSAEPQNGVDYFRFAAVGDVVPLASSEAIDVLMDIQGGRIPELANDLQDLNQIVIPGPEALSSFDLSSAKKYVEDAHGIYEKSEALSYYELPFTVTQWEEGVYYYPDNATASLPGIDVEFSEFVEQAYHAVMN